MKPKSALLAAAGTGLALAGLAATRLFGDTKKLNVATAEVIGQLKQTLDIYESMLRLLAEKDMPSETAVKLFSKLGPAIRVNGTPWNLSAAASADKPRQLNVSVNGPVELLVALQRALMESGLPLIDYEYMRGGGSDSVLVKLEVDNMQLVDAVHTKLTT